MSDARESDNDIIPLPATAVTTQVVNLMHGNGSTLACHLTIDTPAGSYNFMVPTEAVGIVKGALEEYQANLRRVLAGDMDAPAIAVGE
jgi:hypothetical protein